MSSHVKWSDIRAEHVVDRYVERLIGEVGRPAPRPPRGQYARAAVDDLGGGEVHLELRDGLALPVAQRLALGVSGRRVVGLVFEVREQGPGVLGGPRGTAREPTRVRAGVPVLAGGRGRLEVGARSPLATALRGGSDGRRRPVDTGRAGRGARRQEAAAPKARYGITP